MFQILFKPKAEKQFHALPKKDKERVRKAIDGLSTDPHAGKKLLGELSRYYSLRLWPYRIIYTIDKKIVTVTVVAIGQRQGIYKQLKR